MRDFRVARQLEIAYRFGDDARRRHLIRPIMLANCIERRKGAVSIIWQFAFYPDLLERISGPLVQFVLTMRRLRIDIGEEDGAVIIGSGTACLRTEQSKRYGCGMVFDFRHEEHGLIIGRIDADRHLDVFDGLGKGSEDKAVYESYTIAMMVDTGMTF